MPKASWGNIDGNPFEEELGDFAIYDGELPPKGVYRFRLKMLRLKKNRNGDPMLNGLLEINEPGASKKKQYNGYGCWFNLNVTKQGAPWVNNFLASLVPEDKVAALRKAFWDQKVMLDKEEPPNVVSIGTLKLKADDMPLVSAQCAYKASIDGGDKELDPKRFVRPTDFTAGEEPTADTDEEEWETEDEPEEGAGEAEDADEEYNARAAELEAMTRAELLRAAKAAGVSVKRGTPEDTIIDAVLEAEFPEPEEDEEEPEDEEVEEDEEIEEEDEVDEEPEEEPEPPKPTRRRRAPAAAKPADTPPPAPTRARTGTRRRKGSGEPPF